MTTVVPDDARPTSGDDRPEPRSTTPSLGAKKPRGTGAALLVAIGIFLSRVFGLVRSRVMAKYLGTSDAADAFTSASRIPNFLQNLFGEGVLSASFIPVYSRLLAEGDEKEADRVAGAVFGLLAACCFVVGISTGASATSRPLGAAFLGGIVGLGGFFFLAVYVMLSVFGKGSGEASIPSEAYAGIAIVAAGGGIVTLIGALIGWSAAGKKN